MKSSRGQATILVTCYDRLASRPPTHPSHTVTALLPDRHRHFLPPWKLGLWTPVGALLLVLWLPACSQPRKPAKVEYAFDLVDVVDFQRYQVSTDLISAPRGIGLQNVGIGWSQESDPDTGDSWLELTNRIGQLKLYSADADLEQIDLEVVGHRLQERQRKVQIRLNGKLLERIRPSPLWTSVQVEVPRQSVRRGTNLLEVVPRLTRKRSNPDDISPLRLRRLRARSHTGRRLWPSRLQQIRAVGAEDLTSGDDQSIEMPVASHLELVLTLPSAAQLMGSYQYETAPESGGEPAYLYVQLLDETNSERTLFHKRVYKSLRRPREMSLDLVAWSGQMVRLRIGTTGSGNGVFRWSDLRLAADQPVAPAVSLPPIGRQTPPHSGKLGQPDVLVILLDAARADAFSPFGGPHPTPATERLARTGTVFSQALSPAPWTAQSVPAILTGLFPDSLHVGPWGSRLPEIVPTLAESMLQAGYRTVLWSQHPLYSNHTSLQRGFEEIYRSLPKGAYDVLPSTANMLAEDRPTFAWVHLIPPHAPYTPPAPFRGVYSSWYTGAMSVEAEHLDSFPRGQDPVGLSDEDRRYALDRYLENAAFADHLMGQILTILDEAGRYEETLIVLLSDHGEAFMEHGRFLHTDSVHREFLHVPLVIKWPRSAGIPSSTVAVPVSLVDLAPTLVDALALPTGGGGFQGQSLLPAALENRPPGQPVYAMTRGLHDSQRPPNIELMLEMDGWRLLIKPEVGDLRLYRAEADPGELVDLVSELPLQALFLRQAAISQWHRNRNLLGLDGLPEEVDELEADVLEQLEALGYLN